MPSVAKQEAIDQLAVALTDKLSNDDLADFYNEMFPLDQTTVAAAGANRDGLLRRMHDYVGRGLEPEEIVDLWNVAYPAHHSVYFDEEDDQLRFDEESDSSCDDD